MAVKLYRNTLFPGEWTYVWSRDGNLSPTGWTIGGQAVPSISLALRAILPWDAGYHHALRIPTNLSPGPHTLQQGTIAIPITIEQALDTTTPSAVLIDPSVPDAATAIEGFLNNTTPPHNGNVALAGGTYVLDRAINVPSGRTIRGHGATLIRNYAAGQSFNPFFNLPEGSHVLLEGLTFAAERQPAGTYEDLGFVALAYDTGLPVHTNVTLRRCVFRNVQLGFWAKPGMLAEDCRWEEGGGAPNVTGPALFLRCTFRGLPDPVYGNAWSMMGGSGIALLDCDFTDTDRGPVLNASSADIEDNLISGLACARLAHYSTGNPYEGCEGIGISAENGYGVNNNLFLHLRYRGEGAGFVIYGANATNNYLREFALDGGMGIALIGAPPVAQQNNTIKEGEVRGGRCIFDGSATGNTVEKVAFVGPRPTRGDVFSDVAQPGAGTIVLVNASRNNADPTAQVIRFARLLDGWVPTS